MFVMEIVQLQSFISLFMLSFQILVGCDAFDFELIESFIFWYLDLVFCS
jgi:hypothetical protein